VFHHLFFQDALHMASPPPFHDMALPIIFFILAEIYYCSNRGRIWNIRYHLLQMSTMIAVHLFRDAARRGLRVAYLYTIPPGEPFGLFPFFLPFFPLITRCVLALTDVNSSRDEQLDSPLVVSSENSYYSQESPTRDALKQENDEAMFY
jgi:hypothetical protein